MENGSLDELDDSRLESPVPWLPTLIAVGLLFSHLPLGLLLGMTELAPGARAFLPGYPWNLVGLFAGYLAAVHAILVWPVAYAVYPQTEARWPAWRRVAFVTTLISLPLVSFGYYLGTFRSGVDYAELLLSTFPSALVATLLYESCRRSGWFSVVLAVTTFVPLFVLNDILGPVAVAWSFIPDSGAFYELRKAAAVVGVAFTLGATRAAWWPNPAEARPTEAS